MFHIVERLQVFSPDFYDDAKMRAFRTPLSASSSTRNLDTADSHSGEYTDLWQLIKLTGAGQTKQISMFRPDLCLPVSQSFLNYKNCHPIQINGKHRNRAHLIPSS